MRALKWLVVTSTPTDASIDLDRAQRHTLRVLMLSQVLGGVGLAAGATVGALLAYRLTGRTLLAGLGGTFQTLGSAVLALPIAAIAQRGGRRPSLTTAYALAALGAILIVLSAALKSFPVFLVGSGLLGAATAANNAARYAATDLARWERRGRDLSLVVWVTTLGSVLGPNLAGPAKPLAQFLHIDPLVGPFVISAVVLAGGAITIRLGLIPDPLLLARARADAEREPSGGALGRGWRAVSSQPRAVGGVTVMALGHLVMVAVMVMTPLHLTAGHASLEVVGLVISGHILGMFAFAPLMGMAVDRAGAPVVALAGGVTQAAAAILAGLSGEGFSIGLALALFLLGLGWSATLVSGSTILVGAVSLGDRAPSQGLGDMVMGLTAAAGGVAAGIVVDQASFAWLGGLALVAAMVIIATALMLRRAGKPAALVD